MKKRGHDINSFSNKGKRGQAAMEFLMTYGWAILAAIIVVAALWLVIGNTGNLSGNRAILSQPFTVVAHQLDAPQSVLIEIRNGAGETVTIQSVTAGTCGSNTANLPRVVGNGDAEIFTVTCDSTYNSGDRITGDLSVTYNKQGSTLNQTSTGSIASSFS